MECLARFPKLQAFVASNSELARSGEIFWNAGEAKEFHFCPPEGVSGTQLPDIVKNYLEKNPASKHAQSRTQQKTCLAVDFASIESFS